MYGLGRHVLCHPHRFINSRWPEDKMMKLCLYNCLHYALRSRWVKRTFLIIYHRRKAKKCIVITCEMTEDIGTFIHPTVWQQRLRSVDCLEAWHQHIFTVLLRGITLLMVSDRCVPGKQENVLTTSDRELWWAELLYNGITAVLPFFVFFYYAHLDIFCLFLYFQFVYNCNRKCS